MPNTSIEYTIDQDRVRWPGSGSAITTSSFLTPFGYFDGDIAFQNDGPRAASWAAIRLGYPQVDVELIDMNFYACFEEATLEYAAQVNQFNIRNNIGVLQGTSTSTNITQTNVAGSGLPYMIKLSQGYGTEFGVGGNVGGCGGGDGGGDVDVDVDGGGCGDGGCGDGCCDDGNDGG